MNYYTKMIEQEVDALKKLLEIEEDRETAICVMKTILTRLNGYCSAYMSSK